MPTVIIHIQNEEAFLGELDEIPAPTDSLLIIKNPRRKDGKDLANLDPNVTTVVWPVQRINYLEILPSGEDGDIISFLRE